MACNSCLQFCEPCLNLRIKYTDPFGESKPFAFAEYQSSSLCELLFFNVLHYFEHVIDIGQLY